MMFWHLDYWAVLYATTSKWVAVARMCISCLLQEYGSRVRGMAHSLAGLACLQFGMGGFDTMFFLDPSNCKVCVLIDYLCYMFRVYYWHYICLRSSALQSRWVVLGLHDLEWYGLLRAFCTTLSP